MKSLPLVAAIFSASIAAANPYTEGWMVALPDPSATNQSPLMKGFKPNSLAVITNSPRPKLKSSSKFAAASLSATPQSLDGLQKSLPAPSDARIRELARGLEYNWEKCFDFVRDNIAFSLYPGIMRGPDRVLIDREGNDADQAFLLVALLRASGYSTATVVYEPYVDTETQSGFVIPIFNYNGVSRYNLADLLGIKSSGSADVIVNEVTRRFAEARVQWAVLDSRPSHFVITHYWVKVTVDGVMMYLDPSLKPCVRTQSRDVLTDAGYDRSALLSSAGGSRIAGLGVKNLSSSGIGSYLSSLCDNLDKHWTNANETASYFVGSVKIIPKGADSYFHGEYLSSVPVDLLAQPIEYQNDLRTKVVLTHNQDAASAVSFYLDEVGLRNIWLTSFGMTTALQLDDSRIKTFGCSSTDRKFELLVDVQHIYQTTHPYYLTRGSNCVYSLTVGFGGDAKNGIRKFAAEELSRIKDAGYEDSSPRMLAASLYLQGQHWLSQCAMGQRIQNKTNGDTLDLFYSIGISGQDKGPYVDMANSFAHSNKKSTNFSLCSLLRSALEHSVVEQLNDVKAVSTVKLLNLANEQGLPVYYANSENCLSVIGRLSGYGASFGTTLTNKVQGGGFYVLPSSAQITLNNWTGVGYVMHSIESDRVSSGMIISGGMNGGYAAEEAMPNVKTLNVRVTPSNGEDTGITFIGCADPVTMPFGRLNEQDVDLRLNRASPLVWSRNYSSDSKSDSGLGRGWCGSYGGTVSEAADPDSVFGARQTKAALPIVVALSVSADLLEATVSETLQEECAHKWLTSAMAIKWAIDFLAKGTLVFDPGDGTQSFQKCHDGTYVGAPGTTTKCLESNGTYRLVGRDGAEVRFGSDKKVHEMVDSFGRSTRLTYSPDGRISHVENDFDAALDFTWSNGHISRVTDSTGLYVDYIYTNGCLINVIKDLGREEWSYYYDGMNGRMVSKVDPLGHTLFTNEYDDFGRVIRQVYVTGGVYEFGYAEGLYCWNRNPLGFIARQMCDEDGRTTMVQSRYGGKSFATYNGAGHIVRSTSSQGLITEYGYDARMNVITKTNRAGEDSRVCRYWYDDNDRLIAFTNDIGGGLRYEYDGKGRKIRAWDADGRRSDYEWNDNGTLKAQSDYDKKGAWVQTVAHEYNAYGLMTGLSRTGVGLPQSGVSETHIYNEAGMRSSVVNPGGHEWKYTYDRKGRLLTTEDPYGRISRTEYDVMGHVMSTTDALNRRTEYSYTRSGKIASVKFADGSISSNEYDLADNLVATIDALGNIVRYERDSFGEISKTSSALGDTTYVRDASGRIVTITNVMGNVSRSVYDEFGRLVLSDMGGGVMRHTEYDLLDRPIREVDPDGREVRKSYSTSGNVNVLTRNSGAKERFFYDFHNKVCRAENAEGHAFVISRDALGRTVAMTNAIGRQVYSATYDVCGNCISEVNGNDEVFECQYNNSGLPVRNVIGGVETRKVYNELNLPVRMEKDGAGSVEFQYSNRNRLTSAIIQSRSVSWCLGWEYDACGRAVKVQYADGHVLVRTFDSSGRLIAIRDWLGNQWAFTYNAAGRLLVRQSPDGLVDVFDYDRLGRLTTWNLGGFQGRTLTRTVGGRRLSELIDVGMKPVVARHVNRRLDFNNADQVLRIDVDDHDRSVRYQEVYYHDNNGSVTNIQFVGTSDGDISFGYREGTAVGSIRVGGVLRASFATDASGNRVWFDDSCFIPDYTDTLSRPIVEVDGSGNLLRSYIWAGGVLLGVVDEKLGCLVVRTDPHGNVSVVNKLNREVVYSALYGPNGERWGQEGVNPTPFGWQGGYGVRTLPDLGPIGEAYLMGARIYSTTLRRFLSSDPTYVAGGLNLYAYANGNPLANNDPTGLCSEPLEVPGGYNNVYSMHDHPPGGMYREGDLVILDNGHVYRVNEDMWSASEFSFSIERKPGAFFPKVNLKYGHESTSFKNELLYTGQDGDALEYQNGNEFVNYRIMVNNVCQITPPVVHTYQLATSQPKNIVEFGWTIHDAVDVVNEWEEAKNNILPYARSTKQKYFVNNVSSNSGRVDPISPIHSVHYPQSSNGNNRHRKRSGGNQETQNIFKTPEELGGSNMSFAEKLLELTKLPELIEKCNKLEEILKDEDKTVNGDHTLDINTDGTTSL